jgi:hypothetical protein
MTLRVPEPTKESVEAVRTRLSELAGRMEFRHRALAQANPLNLALAAPHDVYFLSLTEVAEGASIDAARIVGRRFMVMEGDNAIASAEVAGTEDGSHLQANEGPYVASTAATIARAEEDRELADGEYEVRMLRIPALYVMALWLKDEQGDKDVLIPLDPAPSPLEAGRRYPPEEMLDELAPLARERLPFDDVGGSPSRAP